VRRRLAIPLSVAAALVLGAALVVAAGRAQQAPVYTVAALAVRVQQQPQAWAGRTLRVRGLALPALDPSCTAAGAPCFQLLLRDPASPSGGASPVAGSSSRPGPVLAVVPGGTDPLLARLRQLPLLAAVVPRPQVIDPTGARTYRLRLERWPLAPSRCASLSCFRGVLLDAAPVAGQVAAGP
jgi:hypothetical protein